MQNDGQEFIILETLAKYVEKKANSKIPWYNFRVYDLFANPNDSELLLKALTRNANKSIEVIDYFVPIPKSGLLIASSLQNYLSKPMIVFDKVSARIKEEIIKKKEEVQISFVDSCINRRGSFITAINEIREFNIEPQYLTVLLYNDLWPTDNEILGQLIDNNRFLYLKSISDLINHGLIE